jgi:hypothetical protein
MLPMKYRQWNNDLVGKFLEFINSIGATESYFEFDADQGKTSLTPVDSEFINSIHRQLSTHKLVTDGIIQLGTLGDQTETHGITAGLTLKGESIRTDLNEAFYREICYSFDTMSLDFALTVQIISEYLGYDRVDLSRIRNILSSDRSELQSIRHLVMLMKLSYEVEGPNTYVRP